MLKSHRQMCAHKPEHIMNITNEKNIQIRIYRFTAIIIIIMLLLLLNTYKFRIVKNYNESNFSPEIKEINLSAEDKLKEFDFIYEILTVNMPSITLFNEKYGINFIENYKIITGILREKISLKSMQSLKNFMNVLINQ